MWEYRSQNDRNFRFTGNVKGNPNKILNQRFHALLIFTHRFNLNQEKNYITHNSEERSTKSESLLLWKHKNGKIIHLPYFAKQINRFIIELINNNTSIHLFKKTVSPISRLQHKPMYCRIYVQKKVFQQM